MKSGFKNLKNSNFGALLWAFVLSLLLILALFRGFEWSYFRIALSGLDYLKAVNADLLYILCLVLIFPVLYLLSWGKAWIVATFGVLLVMFQTFLVLFYVSNQIPFLPYLLRYTGAEMLQIMMPEMTGFRMLILSIFIVFYLLIFKWLYHLFSKIKRIAFGLSIALWLAALIVVYANRNYLNPSYKHFENTNQYYYVLSKPMIFLASWGKAEAERTMYSQQELKNGIEFYLKHSNANNCTSLEYPLEHTLGNENELGAYFEQKNIKPDVVVILVESLSRCVSGPDAAYGSYTPFLDQLAKESLYFDHFYSNFYCTAGVLPNVLTSAPTLLRGSDIEREVSYRFLRPRSIAHYLLDNGYEPHFYYPSWAGFDNYDLFLMEAGIENITSDKDFDSIKYHKERNEGTWGYTDQSLYDLYVSRQKQKNAHSPTLDVLMTISTHGPFQDYMRDMSVETLNRYAAENHVNMNNPKLNHKDVKYAFLYIDSLLKKTFHQLRQLPNYQNTIFIIVGDHNLRDLPLVDDLDAYHVPLFIYSPLLRKPQTFSSVSSQIDIAPSLVRLLKGNFGLKFPEKVYFMGRGLDTSVAWRAEDVFPLGAYSTTYSNFVYKNFVRTPLGWKKMPLSKKSPVVHAPFLDSVFSSYLKLDFYVSKNQKIAR